LKQSKTTVNGEKLGQTLAPVMVKPPPTTNTFPVEKKNYKSKQNPNRTSNDKEKAFSLPVM
jgi:hypothetical protein